MYKKYLNIEELVEYTTLSRSTLYRKVNQNLIPYKRVGSKIIFNTDEIDEWLNNNGRMSQVLPKIKFIS